jgi:metal-responsive CopG/Arc/MetJ family transcriptional regulator
MSVKKFAISISEEVMDLVDRAAAERGVTRSRFITNVLHKVARARRDAEITRQINQLFLDPELEQEQRETATAFLAAGSKGGTKW